MTPLLRFTGDADLAAAFGTARARCRSPDPAADPRTLATALSALALGDHDRIARTLGDVPSAVLPLVAARLLDWIGDAHAAAALWPRVRAAAETVLAGDDLDLALATATELQRTATDVGEPGFAATLLRFQRTRTPLAPGDQPAVTDALDLALRHPGTPGDAADLRQAWIDLERGSVAAAVQTLRDPVAARHPAYGALFVHGFLGVRPDANRGRIRIAPRIPSGIGSFAATPLRFADGALTLRADVSSDVIDLHIEQDQGAVPFTALLEPLLPWTPRVIMIDGRTATLDVRAFGTAFLAPVQLALDAPRSLQLRI